jgi:hypothetical protein
MWPVLPWKLCQIYLACKGRINRQDEKDNYRMVEVVNEQYGTQDDGRERT